jgi:hypothetical protein
MSTSWKPAGQSTDFTSDFPALLQTFFTGANGWNDTTGVVAEADIKFGTDWWDENGDYQIHFRDTREAEPIPFNGWARWEHHVFVDIHVFVRRVTEDRPDQLFQIKREIKRIVGQGFDDVGSGIQTVRWAPGGGLQDITDKTNDTTTWHLVGTLECFFHMVNTSG